MKKSISVVMATYNGESYLEEQLLSIMEQSFLPMEIIILDDCSTDNTKKILLNFKKKYDDIVHVSLVLRDSNVGYIYNFLDGISKASGDIVVLSDQDDVWMKNKLEFSQSFFTNYPDCIAMHSEISVITENGELVKERWLGYQDTKLVNIDEFVKRVNYPGMALAFNRSSIFPYLDTMIKSKLYLSSHDWAICFVSALSNGFYITDKILSSRRYTGKNVALRLQNKYALGLKERILGIETYLGHYKFAEIFLNNSNISSYSISPFIYVFNKRRIYLESKSILKWLGSVINIKYYPTLKAYFADLFYIIKK